MKRILPVLSGLLLLIVPAAAQAQSGDNYGYSTNLDGSITITNYTGLSNAISIPSNINGLTVTGIGSAAFFNLSLTSVTMPETVTSIGSDAFGRNALTSVTIPASVTNIDNAPFFRCLSLAAINVETGNPFYTNVEGALIGPNLTTVVQYPPAESGGSYTVPNGVVSIGTNAFAYCSNLTSVAFPSSLTTIPLGAFDGCANLTSLCFAGNYSTNLSSSAFEEDPLTNILYAVGATGWGSVFPPNSPVGGTPTFPSAQCGDSALYGYLQVTITPVNAADDGAEWQVDNGPAQLSGATVTNLSAGSHTVSFTTISGWSTPGNQNVTITDGTIAAAFGSYTTNALAKTGSLEVTITPSGAISNGAMWEVVGGTPQSSGATVSNLPVGSNPVVFTSAAGWIAPANQSVTIEKCATTTTTGVYTAIGSSGGSNAPLGAVSVTLLPVGAVSEGALWQMDGGAGQTNGASVTNLIAGLHTVSFTTIFGRNTPVTQNVTVTSNAVTNVTGVYTMIGTVSSSGALSVALLPAGLAGAGWQVDGGPLEGSGAVVTNLSPGSHTVSFATNVSGYITPPEQTNVIITSGVTTLTSGIYTQTNAALVLLTNGFGTIKLAAAGPAAESRYKVTAVPKCSMA
jgi:hypothetical protein